MNHFAIRHQAPQQRTRTRTMDDSPPHPDDVNYGPGVDYAGANAHATLLRQQQAAERNAEAERLLEETARHHEERVVARERELDARERALNARERALNAKVKRMKKEELILAKQAEFQVLKEEHLVDREREGAEAAAEAEAEAAETKSAEAKIERLVMID
ncbi:hypothetical protein BBJ28_00026500 [Nothophytophthora sp. Chile5]|nr:hypothetical protein BBJ28_00026500 [Nothophytophthora sp. Chile5]